MSLKTLFNSVVRDFEGATSGGSAALNRVHRSKVPLSSLDQSRMRITTTTSIGKLLVTGGTGFIGGAVLAELFEGPYWALTLVMIRAANLEEARNRLIASARLR